jgi:tetratricopeptide (TPR) repeat protein
MKTLRTLTIGTLMAAAALPAMAQMEKWGCNEEALANPQPMMEAVSLYQENVKQYKASKDQRYLQEAYPQWKTIVANCPKQSKNLYINGANILKVMIANAKSAEEKAAYIEELMAMYDTRIAKYGEAAKYTAKKANELEEILKEDGLQQYYALYSEAVKIGGDDLEAAYLVKYMEATINYVRAGYAEPTLVVDNYDIASDLLEDELQKNAADSVKAATIRGYIAGVEAAFSPYATCDQLVEIYSKKFEADPENVELLKKITGIMMRKRCTEQDLFFRATENLYRLEPSPATAMRMGQMCISKKQYHDAVKYLNDAIQGVSGKDKYNAYLFLGYAHTGAKNWSAARTAYNNAAAADATKGEPYMRIALLYASTVSSASEDNVGGKSAYWAAVDKLQRSKSVEPTEENIEACNSLISSYASHFPSKTDAFMAGLENGKAYRVPGWIGETTIVRTR